jgi:hypothetical protein
VPAAAAAAGGGGPQAIWGGVGGCSSTRSIAPVVTKPNEHTSTLTRRRVLATHCYCIDHTVPQCTLTQLLQYFAHLGASATWKRYYSTPFFPQTRTGTTYQLPYLRLVAANPSLFAISLTSQHLLVTKPPTKHLPLLLPRPHPHTLKPRQLSPTTHANKYYTNTLDPPPARPPSPPHTPPHPPAHQA